MLSSRFTMKAILTTLVLALSLSAHAAERVALVIGNDAYQHARPLKAAVNDATAVAGALQKLGFETVSASNAGLEQMIEAMETLKTKASGAKAVLVYYAGHGIESQGTNYLVPVDAKLERELQLRTQTLSLDLMLQELSKLDVPARIVLLDCCRDNPLEGRSWLATRSTGSGGLGTLSTDELQEATLVVYSASPGKPALDRVSETDRHSPFTAALLEKLPRPGVHSFEVFGQVEESVLQRTASRQKPRLFYSGSTLPFRNFHFATATVTDSPPAGPVVMAPGPASLPTLPDSSPPPVTAANPAPPPGPALPARGYFGLDEVFQTGPYAAYNSYTRTGILKQVQAKLKSAGHYSGSLDGIPGPGTQRAIIAWQRSNQVEVSGRLSHQVVSGLSLGNLREQSEPPPAPPSFVAETVPFRGEIMDMSIADLASRISRRNVTVIDVNGSASFSHGHVPSAINYASVKNNLSSVLPADKNSLIVVYCGGPACSAYKQAAAAVLRLGYTNVKHMSAGISGWRMAGERLDR